MRERLAIFFLAAGNTAWRLLLILAGMAAAQTVAFVAAMHRIDGSLDQVFKGSGTAVICGAAFILYCFAICFRTVGGKDHKTCYILKRLPVSEKKIFVWWSVYNTMCFLLFWGLQIVLLLIFCRIFKTQAEAGVCGAQTVFITFYENGFLQAMLPMGMGLRYISNFVLILAMGILTAPVSMGTTKKNMSNSIVMLVPWTLLWFAREGDTGWIFLMVMSGMYIIITLVRMLGIGGVWNEEIHD